MNLVSAESQLAALTQGRPLRGAEPSSARYALVNSSSRGACQLLPHSRNYFTSDASEFVEKFARLTSSKARR